MVVNLAVISKITGGTFIYVEVGGPDCHSGRKVLHVRHHVWYF